MTITMIVERVSRPAMSPFLVTYRGLKPCRLEAVIARCGGSGLYGPARARSLTCLVMRLRLAAKGVQVQGHTSRSPSEEKRVSPHFLCWCSLHNIYYTLFIAARWTAETDRLVWADRYCSGLWLPRRRRRRSARRSCHKLTQAHPRLTGYRSFGIRAQCGPDALGVFLPSAKQIGVRC